MPEYPHLDDTIYPNAANVDVYKYENTFDYSRWQNNVQLKICNVPWESDGKHTVKFDDDSARNAWFDSLAGDTVDLATYFHTLPSKADINVPISYDACVSYNYVRVKVPIMPTDGAPIEYSSSGNRYEYQHWFIMDIESLAPNTTKLTVQRDWWTDFINEANISYMMLERGHAPMKAISADDYFNNPMAHTEHLGAADVDYGGTGIVKDQSYTPIGNGEKWILVFSNMEPWSFDNGALMTEPFPRPFDDNVTRSAETHYTRQFEDYGIDWSWEYGGYDYNPSSGNARTAFNDHRANRVSNNVAVIAVLASDVHKEHGDDGTDFFNCLKESHPQYFQTIFGIANVSRDMITLGDRYDIETYHVNASGNRVNYTWSVYEVTPQSTTLANLSITKECFALPRDYVNIAKLYTSPYCHIEVVNESGNVTSIRVEDCTASVKWRMRPVFSFPWVKMTAFLTGVGGDADSVEYTWHNLVQDSNTPVSELSEHYCYGDMWKNIMYQYDIPVFAVYQSESDLFKLHNYSRRIENGKFTTENEYHNSIASTETERYNVVGNEGHQNVFPASYDWDGAAFPPSNHTRDDDVGTAYTSEENSFVSAKGGRLNSVDSARVGELNTNDGNAASRANAQTAWDASTENAGYSATSAAEVALHGLFKTLEDCKNTVAQNTAGSNLSSTVSTMTTMQSMAGNVAQSAATAAGNLAASAASIVSGDAGAAAGQSVQALVAPVNSAIDVGVTVANLPFVVSGIQGAATLASTAAQVASEKAHYNTKQNIKTTTGLTLNYVNGYSGSESDYTVTGDYKTGYNYKIVKTSADSLKTQTNNTADTSDDIAERTKKLVIGGSYGGITYAGTAMRSEDSVQWQATNSRHTARFNANKSGAMQRDNAYRTAKNARNTMICDYLDAQRKGQRQFGEYKGNAQWEALRMRGLQVRFMRQSDGAICAAGDQMLRYGYMYDRAWRFTTFNVMGHFTYWKCSDVWLTGGSTGMVEEAQNAIKDILYNGTTVWHNPDEIGRFSIYQNWGE